MTIKILYHYITNSKVIDSLQKPEGEYLERYRLVADKNKLLTKDGDGFYSVIDIDKEDEASWYEVDGPKKTKSR